jgi:ribosome-associated heat shock protein Hsp15
MAEQNGGAVTSKIRLDKWLWAARFFKTRNLAKQAIEGGKVHYDGQRCKVSKEIQTGAVLTIRQGWDSRDIQVIALSDKRRGAPEALLLYQETPESLVRRAKEAEIRKAQRVGMAPDARPTKKQRRQIHQFKQQDIEN